MNKKIMWLETAGGEHFNEEITKILLEIKQKDTKVEVRSLQENWNKNIGPKHVEYRFYEDIIIPYILAEVKKAEKNGFDAAVIGCFYDPGLETAREICDKMVVTGPAESAMALASNYGHKFSIIVGRRKLIPQMENNVIKYGYKDRLASFRSLDLGVLELQEDKKRTENVMRREVKKAIEEDNAEVVILGCTVEFGFYKPLQKEYGIPVIDSVLSPFKYAEFLVELKKKFGWMQSKIGGYGTPPLGEMEEWKLWDEYEYIERDDWN